MNKVEFIDQLKGALKQLPESEREKSILFYGEIIDDRLEEGEEEEAVVASLEDPLAIATTIIEEMPPVPKAIAKSKEGHSTLFWVLIIVGSPLWGSLAITAGALALSIYLLIFSLILVVWTVALACLVATPLALAICIFSFLQGSFWPGIWELGYGLVLGGFGVFFLYGAFIVSKKLIAVSKKYTKKVISLFKKEDAHAH